MSLNSKLSVANDVSFNSKLYVANDVSLNSKLSVASDTSLNGNLYVSGNTLLNNRLTVINDVSLNSKLSVANDVSFNSKLYVASDVSLNNRLSVANDVSLNSKLYVAGNTLLNNRLTVTNDVSLNSKLSVASDTSLNGNLYVAGNTLLNNRLTVTNDVSLNSKLSVASDVSLNSKLYVASDVSLNNRLSVANDVSLNSKLYVAGNTLLNNRLTVSNDVSLNSKLYVANDVSLNSKLYVANDVSFNNRLSVANDVSLNSNLYVGGNTNLSNQLFVNDVSNNIGINTSNPQFTLDVSGNVNINNKLITKDASFNGYLYVNNDTSLNGNLYVGGNVNLSNQFYINDASNTIGINTSNPQYSLDISGNLRVTGNIINSSLSQNDISLNGNLYVGGTTELVGEVDTYGNVFMERLVVNNVLNTAPFLDISNTLTNIFTVLPTSTTDTSYSYISPYIDVFNFNVSPNTNLNFTVNINTPISVYESGEISNNSFKNTGSSLTDISVCIFKNGTQLGTKIDGTSSNGYGNVLVNDNSTSTLVLYYPFNVDCSNYATGSPVSDGYISGTSNVSINTIIKKFEAGSLYNNGGNSNSSFRINSIPQNAGGYTFSFWLQLTTLPAGTIANVFSFSNSTIPNSSIIFDISGASTVNNGTFVLTTGSVRLNTGININPYISGTFYLFVWTIDTSGNVILYINGGNLYTGVGTYISCPFDTNYITGIPAINGYVDEFRYYNEVLPLGRIYTLSGNSLYNNNIDPSGNVTVRNYQLPTLPGSKYYYNQYLTNISASFPITHTSSGTPTLYEIKFSVNDKKNNPIKNATYGYKANTDITTQDQSGGVVFVKTSPLNYTPANYSFNITSGTIDNATNGAILVNNVYSSNIYNTNTIITKDASLNGNLYVAGNTNLSNQLFVNDASNNVDISGNLTVSAIQIGFDQPTPTGDNASIEYSQFGNKTVLRINVNKDGLGPQSDNLNLNPTGGVGINNDDPQFNLDVSGNANVTGNLRVNKLLRIGPDNPAGGSADRAYLEYVSKGSTDATVLRITTTNDAIGSVESDDINLNPSGGVGIKTDNPAYALDVNGSCNVSNKLISKDVSFNGNVSINNTGDNLNASILSLIYPVGAIYSHYLSGVVTTAAYNATKPSVLMKWSNSTWVSIDPSNGYGVSLVSGNPVNSANGFNNFGSLGGNAKIQPHNHQMNSINGQPAGDGIGGVNFNDGRYDSTVWKEDGTENGIFVGAGTIGSNMFTNKVITADGNAKSNYHPYVVVAMWRRTA